MAEVVSMPGGEEQWSISDAVGPRFDNQFDDVVLVQSLLKIFLTSPDITSQLPASDLDIIDQIFTATLKSGGKFSDGIYGSNTRAAVGILERFIGSPVHDGVIRPIFERDQMGRLSGRKGTKMRELNDFWDASAVPANGGSKKESGRHLLSPRMFFVLYQD